MDVLQTAERVVPNDDEGNDDDDDKNKSNNNNDDVNYNDGGVDGDQDSR